MACTVTSYALRPGSDEVAMTVHRIGRRVLVADTGSPGIALAAARSVRGEPKADRFWVVDPQGRVVPNYTDRVGQG